MPEREPDLLPEWTGELLREAVVSTPAARARIMQQVRTLPAPRRAMPPMPRSRWMRRGLLTLVGGGLATMLLAVAVSLRFGGSDAISTRFEGTALVVGDTVIPRLVAVQGRTFRDTLLDTLRVVEFVMRGNGIRTASVVGEFNDWRPDATRMLARTGAEWRVRALVPRDALRFGYLVNDEHLVSAPPLPVRTAPSRPDSI
jgi:hypothetical protein